MAKNRSRTAPKKVSNRFPLWIILVGTVLVLAALWALLRSRDGDKANINGTGAPSIEVDQEVFDYGEVKLGEKPIRTVVQVTNTGDQTLRFTEAPYIEVLEGC